MPTARILLALLILCLPGVARSATSFGANYDQSHWQSRQDGAVCNLHHPIPRFGLAQFSQDAHGEMAMTIFAERPPTEEGRATLHSRNPDWKPVAAHELDGARLRADGSLLRFSHYNAQRILAELEQGRETVISFEGWWTRGVTELALSPVNFRAALQAHFDCVAALPRPAVSAAGASSVAVLRKYHPQASDPSLRNPGEARAIAADASASAVETAIYFSTDDAGLDLSALDTLRAFAARVKTDPSSNAVISAGHADPRGEPGYNRKLAERRARSVREYLLELGVEPARIRISTYGEESLASQATDTYGLAENRRVTLAITR